METQTQEIQVGQITFIERDDPLPSVPLAVAVARAICRPVERAEVVPVPHPERLCVAQYQPVARPDPFAVVPLVDFGQRFFAALQPWNRYHMAWHRRADHAAWAQKAEAIIADVAAFLSGFDLVTPAEASWLLAQLWKQFAQPQGVPAWLAADTVFNRRRRDAAFQRAYLKMETQPPSLYTVPDEGGVGYRYR